MNVMRAQRDQLFEYGPFTIRRQRPGEGFGPLAIIDQMSLKMDARITMHTRQDEEIFSYVWRGSAQHLTEQGEKTALNAKRAMLVSAGSGVRYEESAPFVETEMLQVYIRPAKSGGAPRTLDFTRADGPSLNVWTLLAGPESSDAPLRLGQEVFIYDLKVERGAQVEVPHITGFSTWLTLLDGIVQVGDERLMQGDSISEQGALPAVRGARDAAGARGHPHPGAAAGHRLPRFGPHRPGRDHRHLDGRRGTQPARGTADQRPHRQRHHHGDG